MKQKLPYCGLFLSKLVNLRRGISRPLTKFKVQMNKLTSKDCHIHHVEVPVQFPPLVLKKKRKCDIFDNDAGEKIPKNGYTLKRAPPPVHPLLKKVIGDKIVRVVRGISLR